jgi:hypothetical protein
MLKKFLSLALAVVLCLSLGITASASTQDGFTETLKDGVLTIGEFTAKDVVAFQDEGHGWGYYYTTDGNLYEISRHDLKPKHVKRNVIDMTYEMPYVYVLTKTGNVYSYLNAQEAKVDELSGKGILYLESKFAASKDTVYNLYPISQNSEKSLKVLENTEITDFKAINEVFTTGTNTYHINTESGKAKRIGKFAFDYAIQVYPSNGQMCFLVKSDGTTYFFNGGIAFKLGIKNVVLASRLTEAPPEDIDPIALMDLLSPGIYIQTAEGKWYRLDNMFSEKPKLYKVSDTSIAKLDIQGTPYEPADKTE